MNRKRFAVCVFVFVFCVCLCVAVGMTVWPLVCLLRYLRDVLQNKINYIQLFILCSSFGNLARTNSPLLHKQSARFRLFFFVVPLCGFEIFYSIFLIDLHSNFCWIILTFFFHLLNCLNVCLSRLIYPLQLKQWWWSISQYNQSCSNFYTSRYMLAKPYNAHSNCLCNINSILFDLYTRIL